MSSGLEGSSGISLRRGRRIERPLVERPLVETVLPDSLALGSGVCSDGVSSSSSSSSSEEASGETSEEISGSGLWVSVGRRSVVSSRCVDFDCVLLLWP